MNYGRSLERSQFLFLTREHLSWRDIFSSFETASEHRLQPSPSNAMLFNKTKMLPWISTICTEGAEKASSNLLCFCSVILHCTYWVPIAYSEIEIESMSCIHHDINWNKICSMVWQYKVCAIHGKMKCTQSSINMILFYK